MLICRVRLTPLITDRCKSKFISNVMSKQDSSVTDMSLISVVKCLKYHT